MGIETNISRTLLHYVSSSDHNFYEFPIKKRVFNKLNAVLCHTVAGIYPQAQC